MKKIKINSNFYNFVEDYLASEEKSEEIFLTCLEEGHKIGLCANGTYYVFFKQDNKLYVRLFVTEKLMNVVKAAVRTWVRYGSYEFNKENIKKVVETLCTPLPF